MDKTTSSLIEVFEYPASAHPPTLSGDGWGMDAEADAGRGRGRGDTDKAKCAVEEASSAFERGHAQGMNEGRATAAEEHCTLLAEAESERRTKAVHLAAEFATERDRFLQEAEQQVVKLALGIAARILRREAQIDPLFLIGAVRVALGQLAANLRVKLRVPADEAALWSETLVHLPNLKIVPSVIADDRMRLGDCHIESEMGSVNLGVAAQLREAERVLFGGKADAPAAENTTEDSEEME